MPNRTKTHFSKESGTFDDGTYADVMHLSLCYQLADGMLRQSLYSLGTLLNGEHFHRLNFMLLLGRLVLNELSQNERLCRFKKK